MTDNSAPLFETMRQIKTAGQKVLLMSKPIVLFGNGFSPFSRKIELALNFKQLKYQYVDGLARENHDALFAVNPRLEVPTLVHNGTAVSQSAHILAYLDETFDERTIFPAKPSQRALARRLEYVFGTTIDAAIVNASLWAWADRPDDRPVGLLEAAQSDIDVAMEELETNLAKSSDDFLFGSEPGVVEFAVWPHIAALKPLGFEFDERKLPNTKRWFVTMGAQKIFREDAAKTKLFLSELHDVTHERTKIAWRGDRIEWILAKGFHDWFFKEISEDRVIWPL